MREHSTHRIDIKQRSKKNMQINVQNNKKITLKIIYEQTPTEIECELTEILEKLLIEFANENKFPIKVYTKHDLNWDWGIFFNNNSKAAAQS